MKRLSKLFIVAVLILAAVAGHLFIQSNAAIVDEFNYRIETTFEENGATITASDVIRIIQRSDFVCPGACSIVTAVRGQATPVKFSNGKYVFVLLGTADHSFRAGNMPYQALRPLPPNRKISELPHHPVNVPPEYVPTIIYLTDMADPESAVIADRDNLQTLIGANVRLVNVSVQLTDEAVSTGIDQLLPWVKKQEEVQKSNENISTSHGLYPETDNKAKPLQSDYPRFLERNDW
ncbi:hypothetical protein QA648_28190 (plasmid) [Rhizobium sp. CB3171]|uniref:hypothetical protein n=1 Tax=Rhizobium sp. CB3171 TaxID=3039157 RepID=UPI0024B20BB7|nr:hypothetical protein [Rhizobium sp. CB3171]WFU04651.1 hypothetical protein QA648_28190 [Rhizobium sp. CB3171]